MSITVYSVSGAPRAWRVLLGLAFKGLDYEINLLQASKKEHKSPEYLEIHPRGTIPALDFNGLILRDSVGILAWLDRQFPDKPLFGTTADEAANIWQVAMEACDYLRAATNEVFFPLLQQGKPLPEQGSDSFNTMFAAAQTLKDECQQIENLLGDQPFIAGTVPTAADAICYPEIRLIERAIDTRSAEMQALELSSFDQTFPRLSAWKKRISELPGVDKTMPKHWV